ncbi:MAG: hypothetical protein PPP58_06140 [Natronomonas sp.]
MDDPGTNERRDEAIRRLAADRYRDAADAYTTAAYSGLAGVGGRYDAAVKGEERTHAGYALSWLLLSGVCHRIVGEPRRCKNRASQASLIAADLRNVRSEPVERAACHEYVAVARVVGDRDAEAAFDRAADAYAAAGPDDPSGWTGDPFLQATTTFVTQLSRPDDIAWDDIHGSAPEEALAHRVRFLRSRLPSLLEATVTAGELRVPRGTTEYGNDNWRCPDCGANDVNHIAGTTLCLRCDGEMVR